MLNEYKQNPEPAVNAPEEKKGRGLFALLDRWFRIEHGVSLNIIPKLAFVALIGLIYIGYVHYHEKTIRRINRMKVEIEDLRTDFTTLKAKCMIASKQSEVARKVQLLGLNELKESPKKIIIK